MVVLLKGGRFLMNEVPLQSEAARLEREMLLEFDESHPDEYVCHFMINIRA